VHELEVTATCSMCFIDSDDVWRHICPAAGPGRDVYIPGLRTGVWEKNLTAVVCPSRHQTLGMCHVMTAFAEAHSQYPAHRTTGRAAVQAAHPAAQPPMGSRVVLATAPHSPPCNPVKVFKGAVAGNHGNQQLVSRTAAYAWPDEQHRSWVHGTAA
jgi:hypothetical protein